MKKPNYKYLALKGGGVDGLIEIGAAKQLDTFGVLDKIEFISGSSAGAISALLLSSGWSIGKIQNIVLNLNLKGMTYDDYAIFDLWRLDNNFGLHKGETLYKWFQKMVNEITGDPFATFEQWHNLRMAHPERKLKDLAFEACNDNTGYNEIFSHLGEHKNVPIVDALRASIAIPGFFSPWPIGGCFYSDGGMQKNCPVEVFETEPGVPNPELLCLWLAEKQDIAYLREGVKPSPKEIHNEAECFVAQVNALLNTQAYYLHRGPYKHKMVYCDTLGIGALQMDLSPALKKEMILSGEQGVVQFMHSHYPEFTEQLMGVERVKQIKEHAFPVADTYKTNKPSVTSLDDLKPHSTILAGFNLVKERERNKANKAELSCISSLSDLSDSVVTKSEVDLEAGQDDRKCIIS